MGVYVDIGLEGGKEGCICRYRITIRRGESDTTKEKKPL